MLSPGRRNRIIEKGALACAVIATQKAPGFLHAGAFEINTAGGRRQRHATNHRRTQLTVVDRACRQLVMLWYVGRTQHPKTDIVVAVVGIVPVAVRGARILWIVVPGAAAQHPRVVAGTSHQQ